MSQKQDRFIDRFKKAFQLTFSGRGGSNTVSIDNHFTRVPVNDLILYPGTRIDYASEAGDLSSSSLVMAAVRWLGRTLPEAPLTVVVEDKNGQGQVEPGHELTKLWKRPNQFYSGATLLKAFAASWIIDGNVYLLKIRSRAGKVVELWYLPHFQVKPCWPEDGSEFISHYEYRIEDKAIRLEREDVVHFRDGLNPANPRVGQSPVASLFREIFSDNESANFSAALLKNFGVPGLIISPSDANSTIDPDQASYLKNEVHRRTVGDERGKPFVAGGPIKIELLSFDPQQLDLKNLRRLPEERVAAVLGVNAYVLGFGAALERSIYNNMSEAREEVYESYLVPLQRYLCEELDTQLLLEFDKRESAHTAFDLSQVRVLQEDRDNLVKRMAVGYRSGFIKRSEARTAIGLPVSAEDDVYFEPKGAEPLTDLQSQPSKASTRVEVKSDDVISNSDVEASVDWWHRYAPDEAADLIDAEAEAHA